MFADERIDIFPRLTLVEFIFLFGGFPFNARRVAFGSFGNKLRAEFVRGDTDGDDVMNEGNLIDMVYYTHLKSILSE